MSEELARGPGRPPKKGKPAWKPANVDDVFDREPGFRYRKVSKDPRNIAKKEAEGWEIISDTAGSKTTMEGGYGRINEGKPLTSVREGYDYVLARIPEDVAQARDEYINRETARRTAALKKQARDEINAPVHGSITLEQKGIRTVIKE